MDLKLPPVLSVEHVVEYFTEHNLANVVTSSAGPELDVNDKLNQIVPYKPDIHDLYRLHKIISLYKRTTVLEFGTGWSSKVMANALLNNKQKYYSDVKSLRRNNPFELFVVDDSKHYLDLSSSRLTKEEAEIASFHYSGTFMGKFNDRICTYYDHMPMVNPDLIYLDGPDQFLTQGDVNNFSTRHPDMMPMSADILRFEHFLTPGTILIVDGRAANTRFLISNFQRNWDYFYDMQLDQHIFFLNELPLGRFNKRQIDFYSS